ncbi:MAG: hypothetical protein CML68_18975 [Rhodobacteraceae bacterium]|nr:hypothetical protein [Paracoccaceae bacterium]
MARKPGRALLDFDDAIEAAPMSVKKVRNVDIDAPKVRKKLKAAARVEAARRASFEAGLLRDGAVTIAAAGPEMKQSILASVCAWAFWGTRGFEKYADTNHAARLFGLLDMSDPAHAAAARQAYSEAFADFRMIDKYVADNLVGEAELNNTLEFWLANRELTADDFLDRLRFHMPGNTPTRARRPPQNPNQTGSVPIPDDLLDAQTPEALEELRDILRKYQCWDEMAGTGAVTRVSAKNLPEGGESIVVEMEPLPNRINRTGEDLKPGQNIAPNFNNKVVPRINKIELLVNGKPLLDADGNPIVLSGGRDGWNRLHLVGPGEGEEMGLGMALGPGFINHDLQNEILEEYIRDMAARVAPYRSKDFHLRVLRGCTTWGNPTPKGLSTEIREPFFRSVFYEVTLTTPSDTLRLKYGLELMNDPLDIILGAEPNIKRTAADVLGGLKPFLELLDTCAPKIP